MGINAASPDTANATIAVLFSAGIQWHGVADLGRWAPAMRSVALAFCCCLLSVGCKNSVKTGSGDLVWFLAKEIPKYGGRVVLVAPPRQIMTSWSCEERPDRFELRPINLINAVIGGPVELGDDFKAEGVIPVDVYELVFGFHRCGHWPV